MGNGGLDSAGLLAELPKGGPNRSKAQNFRVESSVEPHHSIPVIRDAPQESRASQTDLREWASEAELVRLSGTLNAARRQGWGIGAGNGSWDPALLLGELLVC